MKKKLLALITSTVGIVLTATHLVGADVALSDSIVSLAANRTKHYTFKDGSSGESIIVALTLSPYSIPAGDPFTLRTGTRVAIGTTSLDGDFIENTEGIDVSASLVFASTGVIPSSVHFRIVRIGLRNVGPTPQLLWVSSATAPPAFAVTAEMFYPIDALPAPLHKMNYTAQLRHVGLAGPGLYQLSDAGVMGGRGLVLDAHFDTFSADPHGNSWLTTYAGQYARIYTSDVARTNGMSVTTWSNTKHAQTLPAYCGVQEIHSSPDWVFIRSTGLGSYVMGSWTNAPRPFPNLPVNQQSLWQFPRAPFVPVNKTSSPASTIGYFVDGVAMFNSWSGFYWTGTTNRSGPAPGGSWNSDAYVTEGPTFDAGLGHPEARGIHHYHANPIALRYQLGDHVDVDPTTKTYSESTTPVTRHSPILGWVNDGFPIYGPYGYSNAMDPASALRRMESGYVLRDGNFGTADLDLLPATPSRRTTRPLWAQRLFTPSIGSSTGPAVTSASGLYPLGYYMEDYDYLGDHGYTQGVDFDLDEFNGRWCVTPEFPAGTYAYFVALTATHTPMFPYNIGRAYYGEPTGSNVTTMTGTLTTRFIGGINMPLILDPPNLGTGNVILTWSAVEGGQYRVESKKLISALSTWSVLAAHVPAIQTVGTYTDFTGSAGGSAKFYRIGRETFAPFDPVLDIVAPGGSASDGTTVIVTITLSSAPPLTSKPLSVTLAGSIVGTSITRPSVNTVSARFVIPEGATTGAQDIDITFSASPPENIPGALVIY